jgi:hypothetical protein
MVAKAKLVEIQWDADQRQATPISGGKTVDIQFNPESLKVTYANQNRGGNQPGGSGRQFVGSSTSKLSLELLVDTTEVRETSDNQNDVRKKTESVAYFIKPKAPQGNSRSSNRLPPGVSFEWGTFIFRGVVDSMDETLDYFSEQGVPMRATISLSIARQEIEFLFGSPGQASGKGPAAAGTPPPGAAPLKPAQEGDNVQKMAGREGRSNDWKPIAAANGIDNPLRLQAGALLNMSAGERTGLSAGVSAGVSASFGAGASAGASFGARASLGAGSAVGLSAGGQAGFSAGLGGGLGFSSGAGASPSAGVGVSAGAGASFGTGASAGAGASLGLGASAGVSAGASAGTGSAFGARTSAGVSASFDLE